MSDSPIRAYLAELRRELPWHLRGRRRVLSELADHLDQAAAAARAGEAGEDEAEQRAVEQLGPAAQLADDLRAAMPDRPHWPIVAVVGVVACAAAIAAFAIRSSTPGARGPAAIPVSYVRPVRTGIPIVGGTTVLRARARAVLRGMGRSDIVAVEFAARRGPPFTSGGHPAALVVTIGWNGAPKALTDAAGAAPFFPVYVFAAGFFDRPPFGAVGITQLAVAVRYADGATTVLEGGPVARSPGTRATLAGMVVRTIARAADRAGLRVLRITLSRPSRLVANVTLEAVRIARLGRALVTFNSDAGHLDSGLAGFMWVVKDRCGTLLASNWSVPTAGTTSSYADPRAVCPNPIEGFLGYATGGQCPKHVDHPIVC